MNVRSIIDATKTISKVLGAYIAGGRRKANRNWPIVYLNFQDHSTHRRYHMSIAIAASRIPANVVWRFRPKYLIKGKESGELHWWKKKFFRFDFFGLYLWSHNVQVLLTDCPELRHLRRHQRKIDVIRVEGRVPDGSEQDFKFPYLGHPNFLFSAIEAGDSLLTMGSDHFQRRYRICFAGNCDPSRYRYSTSLDQQGVMTRICAKETIENVFESDILKIEKWADKEKLKLLNKQSIVLSNSFKAGLNFTEYCELLLGSDFFLALPGLASPYTHSLYEALSCGCIPILPESPVTANGWVDRQNCLLFRDPKSLIDAVGLALKIDHESLRAMRISSQELFKDEYAIGATATRLFHSEYKRLIFRHG